MTNTLPSHIATGVWVECDLCNAPAGDAGVPIPLPYDTAAEAIQAAIEHADWSYDPEVPRLTCPDCTPRVQHPNAPGGPGRLSTCPSCDGEGCEQCGSSGLVPRWVALHAAT